MPNDAKLGLVVGVALVLLIAVLFFRRDAHASPAGPEPAQAASHLTPATERPAPEMATASGAYGSR